MLVSRLHSKHLPSGCVSRSICLNLQLSADLTRPMPPKKKLKTGAKGADKTLQDEAAEAQLKLTPFQAMVSSAVETIFAFRHRGENEKFLPEEETGPFTKGADGKLPWPILHGGTFLSIVQRAQSQPDWLLQQSHELCVKAGIMAPESQVSDFKREFCSLPVSRTRFIFVVSSLRFCFSRGLDLGRPGPWRRVRSLTFAS